MAFQLEAPQLREGAEGLGEAQQPILNISPVGNIQYQLRETPCELPEGLDVGLGNAGFLDDERVQPAGGGDKVPQRLPETLLILLVEAPTNPKFGLRRGRDGDEPAQVLRAEVFLSWAVFPREVQSTHRAGAPLGPLDDPRGVENKAAKRPPLRRGPRPLFPKVDLERLVQRARVLRAVDLSPLLADQGDGVPHPALVRDRNKHRHEHIIREVIDGLRAVVDGELGDVVAERGGELAGVEGFGHRPVASMLFKNARSFAVLLLHNLGEGARRLLLRRSTGRKAGKRARVQEEKPGFVF